MNAVWTFWSKPFLTHYNSTWQSDKHHYLSWILSLERCKKHFKETHLYTDDYGKKILIDELKLPFDKVSLQLNELSDHDPDFWVLGKLYGYQYQKEPFVHIDNDVFLWKQLPAYMKSASVFFQNPEYFDFNGSDSFYQPLVINNAVNETNGWLPEEWKWYVANKKGKGVCVGIIGGNDIDFINYYATTAIKLIEHPDNKDAWNYIRQKLGHRIAGHCLLFEQYLFSAIIDYHKYHNDSKFNSLNIRYLFNSFEDAMIPQNARNMGYTHLIGPAKKNKPLMERLEQRVRTDYPELYNNCLSVTN